MCGIAGLIENGLSELAYKRIVQRMTDAQQHRGPDDQGIETLTSGHVRATFGHRRLAIIDLSPMGHQPMCDPDTGNWITFNGEIYNYQELKQELEKQGQCFRTQSDTEVILKAFAVWGTDCVRRLRGMFAWAIWQRDGTLILARDPVGIKPLYYWREANKLLFASEVRALLASGLIARRLDLHGLRSYLAYGSVQEPLTLVQNVRSLLPGHFAVWRNGELEIRRYWQLPPKQDDTIPPDGQARVSELLAKSVKMQMIADVPLGAFLSGGIDSSSIVALMQRARMGKVKTFSIVFDEKQYDERVYSRLVAQHVGTEHTELLLRGEDVQRNLERALEAYDQPSVDGLNTYFVAQVARQAGLTVALSGVGGDELFGGYDGYRKPLALERLSRLVKWIPHPFDEIGATLLHTIPHEIARKGASLLTTHRIAYFVSRQVFSPRQIADLLEPSVLAASQDWEPSTFTQLESETREYDSISRASALELQTYMQSTLLRDTDQMSMAHALEVRVPLLDSELIHFLFTLPGYYRLNSHTSKPLLVNALGQALPREIVYRRKQGFELPFERWIRQTWLEEMNLLFQSNGQSGLELFCRHGLIQVWQEFQARCLPWSRVWALYVLLRWLLSNQLIS